jgi:hypothetical protein
METLPGIEDPRAANFFTSLSFRDIHRAPRRPYLYDIYRIDEGSCAFASPGSGMGHYFPLRQKTPASQVGSGSGPRSPFVAVTAAAAAAHSAGARYNEIRGGKRFRIRTFRFPWGNLNSDAGRKPLRLASSISHFLGLSALPERFFANGGSLNYVFFSICRIYLIVRNSRVAKYQMRSTLK